MNYKYNYYDYNSNPYFTPIPKLDIVLNVKMCAQYNESWCKFKDVEKQVLTLKTEQGEG